MLLDEATPPPTGTPSDGLAEALGVEVLAHAAGPEALAFAAAPLVLGTSAGDLPDQVIAKCAEPVALIARFGGQPELCSALGEWAGRLVHNDCPTGVPSSRGRSTAATSGHRPTQHSSLGTTAIVGSCARPDDVLLAQIPSGATQFAGRVENALPQPVAKLMPMPPPVGRAVPLSIRNVEKCTS